MKGPEINWSNDVEDGPPKVTDEELEEIDAQSREVEIERLLEMNVLKKLPPEADTSKYKCLSTKVVYDWRHRDGTWKRRGKLVAREFRWLTSYDLISLYSPTSIGSTVKLLAAMNNAHHNYTITAIDISDACLQVEQLEPTVVEVDGQWYELGFTLPGQ